jgi:quercetin dioxygenase-like cupin family protein
MREEGSSVVVPAGAGDAYWILGHRLTFKLGPEQTGGAFTLAETRVIRGGGPPPHLHRQEEELFYVIEGDVEFEVSGRSHRAPPGTTVYVPRGQFHTVRNAGAAPARLVDVHMPGGFEAFFDEASQLEPGATIERVRSVLRKHGMSLPG